MFCSVLVHFLSHNIYIPVIPSPLLFMRNANAGVKNVKWYEALGWVVVIASFVLLILKILNIL